MSTVEAIRDRDAATIQVRTTNVRRLALGPLAEATTFALDLDGNSFSDIDLTARQYFAHSPDEDWIKVESGIPAGEKRPGLSGPFGDLFVAPTIIVYGLSGTDETSEYNKSVAFGMTRLFNQSNGVSPSRQHPGRQQCDAAGPQRPAICRN